MSARIKNDLKLAGGGHTSVRLRLRVFVLVVGLFFLGFILASCYSTTDESTANLSANTNQSLPPDEPESETNTIQALTSSLEDSEVLANFSHGNEYHARLSCLICHRRDTNSPRMTMPGRDAHTPCIGCHTQQFEDPKNPICTICHTDPEKGAMKRFPPLRSFNVRFDHGKHLGKTSCATCHRPTRGGVAKSIPAGGNAHASCFQCHSSKASHSMSSCSLCHQPGRRPRPVSESGRAFAANFSHAKHNSTNCTVCHSIKAGASRGNQVTSPVTSMHFPPKNAMSCGRCHNNKRAFGGDDFKDCRRCHKGNSYGL